MAIRGHELTLTYVAWDTAANEGRTGDAANHTLRWVKDGAAGAPAAAPEEVDAAGAPGIYRLGLTAADCTCWIGTLAGRSATQNVSIMPIQVTFEASPAAEVWGHPVRTLTGGGSPTILVSPVAGDTITVYTCDTWDFVLSPTGADFLPYESLAFVVKRSDAVDDEDALLIVRSDTGLEVISAQAPIDPANGVLAYDANSLHLTVHAAETGAVGAGTYKAWVKGFDDADPGIARTLVKANFIVRRGPLEDVA